MATKKKTTRKGQGVGGGQPTKYREEYCEQMIEFFSKPSYEGKKKNNEDVKVAKEFPTFVRFAHKIGVDRDTLLEWKKVHPKFSCAYKTCEDLQDSCIMENALHNRYNPAFSMFFLKCNRKWNDQPVQEHNHKVETFKIEKFDDKED